MIECDADALITDYDCRQGTCIPVPKPKGEYKDLGSCEAACKA